MINTPPRDHRPPRPRRAPVAVDDSFDNASGIFSTSGTISECTMASFLLESNNRTNSKPNRTESPRHQMSPTTAALLRRKQEDARVAILSLNRFIFQAGNLYRGKQLNRDEENILRESAHQVGLSLDIADALLEHTSDSNAVVQYCMESEDSFAKKIRKDRRLSQLLKQDASEPEGSFNLKSSIWRILMHKIVQQTLRDYGMDIGDVLDKSSSASHMHTELSHNDEYAMNSAERERYGRDYTEERKRLSLPIDEITNARHRAIAQMEFQQSKGPIMDSMQNRDDIPLMIGAGPEVEYRDDDMSLLDAHGSQHREMPHPAQRLQSSPLTPRSLNLQQRTNERTPPPGRTHHRSGDPAIDENDFDENDYDDIANENCPPRDSVPSRQAPLSAVKQALAMFEGPGKFDKDHSQKTSSLTPKARKGSSSKIADRLALWEKGVQYQTDTTAYQQLERVKSSEHQAIQATSLFDVFSTPQKQHNVEQEHARAASTSKISKVKRAQIAAFENRGFEKKSEASERVIRSEVKKLDPSRRRLFDEPSRTLRLVQEHDIPISVDKHGNNSSATERTAFGRIENDSQQPEAEVYHAGYQRGMHPQHSSDSDSGEGYMDSPNGGVEPADNIGGLKHGWKIHSTPPTRNRRVSNPTSPSVSFASNSRFHDHQDENQNPPEFESRNRGNPKKQVSFGESPANPIRQQGSFSDPQKSAMDKILKKARTPPKPPTPSKQAQRSLKIRQLLLANMNATRKDEHHQVILAQSVPSDNISVNLYHSMDKSLDSTSEEPPQAIPIGQQGSFSNPQKSAMDRILKKARTPPKPPTPSKQAQRSLKIRQQLMANMNMTSKDGHHRVISDQPVASDTISINSYHSMDESLDPTSVQDYGPQREVTRTPRPRRRNIREENFLEDERVRVEPPEHLRNEMFYFDSIEGGPNNMMEEESPVEHALNQDQEYQDIARNMMEEDSLIEQAMNGDEGYQDIARNMMEEDSLVEQAMNRDQEYHDIARNMMEEDALVEQVMHRDQEYQDVATNMMEEDSLMEQAMNEDAHHSNVLVSGTLSSSPGNSYDCNGEDQDQFSELPASEDDLSEDQAYISDMASSRAASDQIPIDSMISSMSSGELIQAPGSQSTMTDDGNRSWVEFHQVFESIHGAKSEVTLVESGLTSSRKSIENMFDTLHQVKQEAISMERRKPEREAKETQKPMETYHPITPRAPKVYDNEFFEDIRLTGSKATFQVTHGSESAGFDTNDKTRPYGYEHEERPSANSNTQVLNVPQTDPEEWAYFQNSHFHSDASYQEREDLYHEEDVEEHFSDITDPRDTPKPKDRSGLDRNEQESAHKQRFSSISEADPSEVDSMDPVAQVAYRSNGVAMATSTLTASSDESNFEMVNPYQCNAAKLKGSSFSEAQERAMEMASDRAEMDNTLSKTTEDMNGKFSPKYPRSPVFDKAMQKARKHAAKESHELAHDQRKEKESSPRYPRSPAFDKALQARKAKASDNGPISQVSSQDDSAFSWGENAKIPTQPSFDYHTLPPPPSLEEAFNLVDTETVEDTAFHQAKTPRTSHGNSKSTTNQLNSIQMQRSSSSLSRFLRIDTSRSDEDDVGLNGAPASGQQSLRQDAVSNWDKAHGGRGASPSAYRSYSEANEDVKSAAQASGVPQQIIDIILKQAAEHERELEEAAPEADRISWLAIEKKTNKKPIATEDVSPIGYSVKSEALYSLPKQKKTKPVKLDVSLIPDDIPEGVPREDVKLLERFIQVSTSKLEGKQLSADSEARVRAAAINVGLAEDVIDQMLKQARWKRAQNAIEENTLHLQEEDTLHQQQENYENNNNTLHQTQEYYDDDNNINNNNNAHHQYYSDHSNTHVHFEDGYSTRHKFGGASPVRPVYPESPGYTVARDERWSSRRRQSEEYNRNACNGACSILGNIKDNLLYWANCQGGGSFDEEEYSITENDLQF